MWQFCYACHDATSQGADTNVQQGIYEGTLYGTSGAVLNGGGFDSLDESATTSTHMYKGSSWGAYGGGYTGTGDTFLPDGSNAGQGPDAFMVGTGNAIKMDCATCHDPHGSANYRILKAVVNGNNVGGYSLATARTPCRIPTPTASSPRSRPAGRSTASVSTRPYPDYKPNYTTPDVRQGLRHGRSDHRHCWTHQRGQGHERLVRGLSQHVPGSADRRSGQLRFHVQRW